MWGPWRLQPISCRHRRYRPWTEDFLRIPTHYPDGLCHIPKHFRAEDQRTGSERSREWSSVEALWFRLLSNHSGPIPSLTAVKIVTNSANGLLGSAASDTAAQSCLRLWWKLGHYGKGLTSARSLTPLCPMRILRRLSVQAEVFMLIET